MTTSKKTCPQRRIGPKKEGRCSERGKKGNSRYLIRGRELQQGMARGSKKKTIIIERGARPMGHAS